MSIALEVQLLGALLDGVNDAQALVDVGGLRPEDFTDARTRGCWQLGERMALAHKPLSAVTLFAEGQKRKLLPDAALGWLEKLEASNTLDKAKFAEVAANVRTQARRSALSQLLKEQAAELDRGGDLQTSADTIEAACRDVGGFGQTHELGSVDVMELGIEWEQRLADGKSLLVPSGIRSVDELIGGWAPNLNIVAGLPSVGKSAFVGTSIEQQLRAGVKVGLFGLEDGTRWLSKRLIARDVGIPVRDVGWAKLDAQRQERYVDVAQRCATLLERLITYRRDTIGTDELCRRISHWVTALGVECIYIDHGGEVEHRREASSDDYRLAVGDTYRRLRNLAVRYQVPIVVLAHTTRASDRSSFHGGEDAPPKVSEIAESAYIERRARVVLGLWTKHGEDEAMRVTVLKQTEGKRGETVRLDRLTTSALLDPLSGSAINLHSERAQEAAKKRATKATAAAEAKRLADEVKRAAKEAKKPTHGILGDVDARN